MRVVAGVALVLLGACDISLPFPGGGVGFVTVVDNRSATPFVLHAHEEDGDRYYAAGVSSTTVVDTVGELNLAIRFLAILDRECIEVDRLTGPFDVGGTVTIDAAQTVSFLPRLQRSGSDGNGVETSCELAAQKL